MRRPLSLRTPEGVEVHLELASLADRARAFGWDLLAVNGLLLGAVAASAVVSGLVGLSGARADGVAYAVGLTLAFVTRNFYFAWSELYYQGRTWGKRKVGLRVIARDGGPLTGGQVMARNLTREFELFAPLMLTLVPTARMPLVPDWVHALSLVWIGALVAFPLLNRDRARIGDLLGGTIVVRSPTSALLPDLVSRQTRRRKRVAYAFTQAQLDKYGIKELQVLEDILRNHGADGGLLTEVSKRIRKKVGWRPAAGQKVQARLFLEDFYAAQRGRLEQKMLMGERKVDKES